MFCNAQASEEDVHSTMYMLNQFSDISRNPAAGNHVKRQSEEAECACIVGL